MNPKLYKRFLLTGPEGRSRLMHTSVQPDVEVFATKSMHDHAALLLSIADIANSEITSNGITSFWNKQENGPMFPILHCSDPASQGGDNMKLLAPRSESLHGLILQGASTMVQLDRFRSVSFDGSHECSPSTADRTMSPISSERHTNTVTPTHSPILTSTRHFPSRKQSLRLSAKARYEHATRKKEEDMADKQTRHGGSVETQGGSPLQGSVPKGVPIKRIMRRKFSWKNYPELEQFLIRNRDEYLAHSALNYTLEQKQYNNRLTDALLELATKNGYIFDQKDFSFTTVRDRIRCFFKSFVQSSKKKGLIFGYAAKKAGLLSVDELIKCRKSDSLIRKTSS